MNNLNQSIFPIITCDKLTKMELKGAWLKTCVVYEIGENQVAAIAKNMFNKHEITINNDALSNLINRNQGNIVALVQDINLLILTVNKGEEITLNLLQQHTVDNAEYNIYQLSRSYLSGGLEESIKILNNIYTLPEDAILINWMLHEDVKRLLKIKNKLREHSNIDKIIRELGFWGESVNCLSVANKRLSYQQLIVIYGQLSTLDMTIKGVKSGDVLDVLKQIIQSFCKHNH
jgi:DNA polymerase-3 subunit delta